MLCTFVFLLMKVFSEILITNKYIKRWFNYSNYSYVKGHRPILIYIGKQKVVSK